MAAVAALADQPRVLAVAVGVWAADSVQRAVRLVTSRAGEPLD